MIGDLRTWGWVTVVLGVLQLAAAWFVLKGNQLARWFAVAVIALYGLCVYGGRENMTA